MRGAQLRLLPGVAYGVGALVGLGIGLLDVSAPWGDDSAKLTILLWLVGAGVLGFLYPAQAWRWAPVVGLGVPAVHFLLHVLRMPDSLNPNTLWTILILVPVSVAVCLMGAYAGVLVRRVGSVLR